MNNSPINLVSKGDDNILKIVGGVAFYVEHFYEKSWFEIIELSSIFFVFLAINRRIFEILIWNLQRICILCVYSMSLKGISQKNIFDNSITKLLLKKTTYVIKKISCSGHK